MSNRFHNKWHRVSHHTYKDTNIIDAGWDPIASHEAPFKGDFVIDGDDQPSSGSLYSKEVYTTHLIPGDGQVDWESDTITAYSNFEVTGNITGDDDLYLKDDAFISGYVHVYGEDDAGDGLIVEKNSHFAGSADIDENLNVDKFLEVHGDISGDSDLYVTGNETVGETLHVYGDVSADSDLYVTGNETIGETLHVYGDMSGDSDFYITGNETVGETFHVYGDVSGDSDLYITGNETVGETLHVYGDISGDSDLYITGNETIGENLHVVGYVHISGEDGDGYGLVVERDSHFIGSADVDENLNVDTYVHINGEDNNGFGLKVEEKTYIGGETTIDDKVSVNKNGLFVTGDSEFKNQLDILGPNNNNISGNIRLAGNLSADDYIRTTGNLDVSGSGHIVNNLQVDDTITAKDVIVTHHLSAVSATFHNIDITASEGRGFIVTGYKPTEIVPEDYYVVPTGSFVHGERNVYLDKVGLFVDGWFVASGESEFKRDVTFDSDVSFLDDIYASAITASGAVVINNTLTVTGNTSLSNLDVSGNTTVAGLTASGDTKVSTLTATGAVDFKDTLNVSGDTTVSAFTANGPAIINDDLSVIGDTTVAGLTASGQTLINSDFEVTGDTTVANFTATGESQFNEAASFNASASFNDDVYFAPSANIYSQSDIYEDGDVNITGDVFITGNVYVDGKTPLVETINVTYDELVDLRDNGALVPGQLYRITDYVATTVQELTRSANHPFDLIVVANTANQINETARAILHEGDTYFANSNLDLWELKYCLDNDSTRFGWADEINGKGVIYYMKDDHDNICEYDFKGIQFGRYKVSYLSGDVFDVSRLQHYFIEEATAGHRSDGGYIWPNKGNDGQVEFAKTSRFGTGLDLTINRNTLKYFYTFWESDWDEDEEQWQIFDGSVKPNGNGNYSSNNLIRKRLNKPHVIENPSGTAGQYLNSIIIGGGKDNFFDTDCYDMTIGSCNNCSFGQYCTENYISWCSDCKIGMNFKHNFIAAMGDCEFGDECYNNVVNTGFWEDRLLEVKIKPGRMADTIFVEGADDICTNNIYPVLLGCVFRGHFGGCSIGWLQYDEFKGYCYGCEFSGQNIDYNVFGDQFNYNKIGEVSKYNTFGNNCEYNIIGNKCNNNTFGDDCKYNVLGNECERITLKDECQSNVFGDKCSWGTLWNKCAKNTIGHHSSASLGKTSAGSCIGNIVGDDSYVSLGDYCSYNNIGSNCSGLVIGATTPYGSANKGYIRYVTAENGLANVCLQLTGTTSVSQYYQNVTLKSGLRDCNIVDNNVDQKIHTTYQPANSQIISVNV